MNKPIEPGCLAIIIGADQLHKNIGRCVRVIRKANEADMRIGVPANRWRIDLYHEGLPVYAKEHFLLRIDGDAESEERIAESKEVPA